MDLKASLFPYPRITADIVQPGSIMAAPAACHNCRTRECTSVTTQELGVCSFGYNYQRLDAETVIAGIVVREFPGSTPARQKRLRETGIGAIASDRLKPAVEAYASFAGTIAKDVADEKERILRHYVQNETYREEFLQSVKPEIQRGLALLHDYKNINKQITENINILIEKQYTGGSLVEKLSKAKPAERAIYEAAKLLGEKLNVADFLLTPEWLKDPDRCSSFHFYRLVEKYRQIYRSLAERKSVRLTPVGKCEKDEVFANEKAVGIIPHTLIDNAVKYSPNGGEVVIAVDDKDEFIDFSVTSWGPFIEKTQEKQIFEAFYRTKHAKKMCDEGSGYGLFVAQLVAKSHFDTEITVEQWRSDCREDRFKTMFSVTLPYSAAIVR
ncbi:MAG: hypothetical protein QOE82_1755 [Thermoanaerobaculia bacterium]|jgi:signal transduction histidine kinase|nr:hypothetical protein [Thermoanaerobaculia bacterium]